MSPAGNGNNSSPTSITVLPAAAAPAPAAPAALAITVTPTQPAHWLVILSIISAVLNAETPLLLQVLPAPKEQAAVVGADIGLQAILAGYEASLATGTP